MINELKRILQIELKKIDGLSSGKAKPDEIIENDEIYYGYEVTYASRPNSVDYSTTDYSITITGRLVGKNKSVATMDDYADQIGNVLRNLRFRTTIQDVTEYSNISKKIINGSASMNDATYFIR